MDLEVMENFLSNYLYSENLSRKEVSEALINNIDELEEVINNLKL